MASDGFCLPLTKYVEHTTIYQPILWVLWWHQELLKSKLRSVNSECNLFPRQNIKSHSYICSFPPVAIFWRLDELFGVPRFPSSRAASLFCTPPALFVQWPKISLCGYCKDLEEEIQSLAPRSFEILSSCRESAFQKWWMLALSAV